MSIVAVLAGAPLASAQSASTTSQSSAELLLQALQSPTPEPTVSTPTATTTEFQPAITVPLGISLQSFGTDNAVVPQAATASTTTTSNASLIQSLYAEVQQLEAQIAALEGKATSTAPSTGGASTFTRNLSLHDHGHDVLALQQFLNSHGFPVAATGAGSQGEETTFFGLATYHALIKYQSANNLPATGYFGPQTRALIAEHPASQPTAQTTTQKSNTVSTTSSTSSTTSTTTTSSLIPVTSFPGYGGGGGGAGGGGSSTPAATCSISASPATVLSGATSTLTWTSSNASSASLDQGIGSVSTAGSQDVSTTTTATYTLSVSGTGGSGTCTATVTIDTPPVISSITSSPLTATSTITWSTDKAADSEVVYGLTTSYGSSTSDASQVTSHSLNLTDLTGGTTYHFAVVSTDAAGGTSTSTDQTFVSSTTPYIASNGWTVFSPSPGTGSCSAGTYTGTCIVYVSSSAGNDTTCAPVAPPVNESGVTPCATLAHAETLIRNNMPDWMLLKRGDTWAGQTFSDVGYRFDGRSADEPSLLSSYGTSGASPLVEVPDTYDSNGVDFGIGTCCHLGANYFAMTGLDFYGYQRDPSSPGFASSTLTNVPEGFHFVVPGINWMLIEGNTFNFLGNDIQGTQGGALATDVTIRRNVFENNYSINSHAQGLYMFETKNLVIQDNIFDHNGWNATLITPTAVTVSAASPAVVTWSGNDLRNNAAIEFSSTGSLPTGLASSTVYCVMNYATTTFNVYNDGGNCAGSGTAINTSGSQSGTQYGIWEDPAPTIFNRNAYLSHGDGNTVYSDNIDAEGSSGGVQQRTGGTTDSNVFLQDPISITYGSNENPGNQNVSGTISNNVILDSENIGTAQPQGAGIVISSNAVSNDGVVAAGPSLITNLSVFGNVIAHQSHGSNNVRAIQINGNSETGTVSNASLHNNTIYDWAGGTNPNNAQGFYFSLTSTSTVTAQNNTIDQPTAGFVGAYDGNSTAGISLSGNTYFSAEPNPPSGGTGWFENDKTGAISTTTWVTQTNESGASFSAPSFTDSTRSIQTYDSSQLGGPGTFADFMSKADAQNYENWNTAYTAETVGAWVRGGL